MSTCWLCFPSPRPAVTRHRWLRGRPAASLITHVTCSRRALASGRGGAMHGKPHVSTAEAWRGEDSLHPFIKMPVHPPWGYTVWPLWNSPPWHSTHSETWKLTAGKWDASGGWPVVRGNTSYSMLSADSAGSVVPFSFLLLGEKWQMMECDVGRFCGQLAYKLAKPGGDGWHMVEYSTFTPPQVIGFNRPCNVKRLIVRKITLHIIHNFMGVLIPKLWEGDIKVHVCSAFQSKSSLSLSRPLHRWHAQIYYVVLIGKYELYFNLIETADM